MSERLVNVDRDTPMMLPPDMREWVSEDHPVHFFIEAVDHLRLPSLTVNPRGTGSPQYPLRMMLSLLLYCYAHGVFSSRRIEMASYENLAVRYLTGNTHPDHDTPYATSVPATGRRSAKRLSVSGSLPHELGY